MKKNTQNSHLDRFHVKDCSIVGLIPFLADVETFKYCKHCKHCKYEGREEDTRNGEKMEGTPFHERAWSNL